MTEIEFSTIHNDEHDLAHLRQVLDTFEKERGARVRLTKMMRGTAWTDLMNIASTGRGPDVSHVGSTWISSLVGINALRSFRPHEIASFGNEETFIPSAWQDVRLIGDPTVWSMPWNSFLYVIFYRKDLFTQHGINAVNAFIDNASFSQTIARLRETNIESPWVVPYAPAPYESLLHQAASWVWSNGGDFVNEKGTQVTLSQPQGIKALSDWLDTQRAVPEQFRALNDTEAIELLLNGRTGAIISHIRGANQLIQRLTNDPLLDTLGFAAMSNKPWCAGDNLIIWQHTQGYPERERIAMDLIRYLLSPASQLYLAEHAHMMPTRRDALLEAYPEKHPLHPVAILASQSGRSYLSMKLWRRMENQIGNTLGPLLQEAYQNPHESSENLVRKYIEPVVDRLNLVIGN